jgi:glutamate N-acetyltransferase / amino-acid N-acetyltransferase
VAVTVTWPGGLKSAGVASGIKPDGALDLGLIVAARPLAWAGTFTKNAAAAAPVLWCRSLLGTPVRALVVNSGNANACTGPGGDAAVRAVAGAAAEVAGCEPEEVLVASTGPIGVALPAGAIVASLPEAAGALTPDVDSFARSILTTDTRVKVTASGSGAASLVGVAKGAAMLAPNMATMLAFLVTDASLDAPALQSALDAAVHRTFDRISVDACESTNDSVFLLATGETSVNEAAFTAQLESACSSLAEQIVRDAEGGSKLVRISVRGAADDDAAVALGRAVAGSTLWRAAVHGADPNWGRVLSALGSVDRSLDLGRVQLSIGTEPVFAHGAPAGSLDTAAKVMAADEFEIDCVVGEGPGAAQVLSSDLSPEYVTLNAYGTT